MNLITKLFQLGGNASAIDDLKDILQKNETDDAWMHSFQRRIVDNDAKLKELLAQFSKQPSDELAEKVIAQGAQNEAERPLLAELGQRAHPAVKARIVERTKPALRNALESIRARLTDELAESKKRDLTFANEGVKRLGSAIDSGWKSEADLAEAEKSHITSTLEAQLKRCEGYLAILDSITDAGKLFHIINFCTGQP
jgi:hypothetical protein